MVMEPVGIITVSITVIKVLCGSSNVGGAEMVRLLSVITNGVVTVAAGQPKMGESLAQKVQSGQKRRHHHATVTQCTERMARI